MTALLRINLATHDTNSGANEVDQREVFARRSRQYDRRTEHQLKVRIINILFILMILIFGNSRLRRTLL